MAVEPRGATGSGSPGGRAGGADGRLAGFGRLAAHAHLGLADELDVPVDTGAAHFFAIVNNRLARECGRIGESGDLVAVLRALVVLVPQFFEGARQIDIAV